MSSGKVNCTCGWSWNKSDSSKKDMYICHECGRDNSNNMKNGGWLDSYADGGNDVETCHNCGTVNEIMQGGGETYKFAPIPITHGDYYNVDLTKQQMGGEQPVLAKAQFGGSGGMMLHDRNFQVGGNSPFPKFNIDDYKKKENYIEQLPRQVSESTGTGNGNSKYHFEKDAAHTLSEIKKGNIIVKNRGNSPFPKFNIDDYKKKENYIEQLPRQVSESTGNGNSKYHFEKDAAHTLSEIKKGNIIVKNRRNYAVTANNQVLIPVNREGQQQQYVPYKTLTPDQITQDELNKIATYKEALDKENLEFGRRPLIYLDSSEKLLGDIGIPGMETSEDDRLKQVQLYNHPDNANMSDYDLLKHNLKEAFTKVPGALLNIGLAMIGEPNAGFFRISAEAMNPLPMPIPGRGMKIKPGEEIQRLAKQIDNSKDSYDLIKHKNHPLQDTFKNETNSGSFGKNIPSTFLSSAKNPSLEVLLRNYDVPYPKNLDPNAKAHFTGSTNVNGRIAITPHYQMGGSLPGATGSMYARIGAPSKGPHRNQTDVTDASAQNGKEVDMYGNPIIADLKYDQSVERTNYNPRTNQMTFGYDMPYILSQEERDKVLAHENRHAWQFANNKTNFMMKHHPDYSFQDRLKKRPEFPSTNEVFEDYHDRKRKEIELDVDNFRLQNPELSFMPNDLVYNKFVDSDQYNNGNSVEGEAQYYQETGKEFQNGGEMKYYQNGLDWKPKSISQNGSIVKDDMGYWNPNNWDSPVEIGSNEITMQDVPFDVLGISDEGDVKYMKANNTENYKYKGKKVTEFRMAQNGLRQEQKGLQNLNNLVNFTNYNTKQPGGWLDSL